jgi:hypothetical protein
MGSLLQFSTVRRPEYQRHSRRSERGRRFRGRDGTLPYVNGMCNLRNTAPTEVQPIKTVIALARDPLGW